MHVMLRYELNTLIIRHLQWHDAKHLRSFIVMVSLLDLWVTSCFDFLVPVSMSNRPLTPRGDFAAVFALSKQTLIGIDANTFYYQQATA